LKEQVVCGTRSSEGVTSLEIVNELEEPQEEAANRFAAFENLNDSKDINRAWENIKENIKISPKKSLGLYE
jgi:hypothetical protein